MTELAKSILNEMMNGVTDPIDILAKGIGSSDAR